MRKRIFGFILAMVMVAAIPLNASAETIKGSSDWQVAFDGNKMSSNFNSADLDASVYQLLPGDTALIELSLANTAKKDTNWYMSNEILQSLEDGSAANGGAYTYILNYKDAKGETTELYNSETVGGEGQNGLHQATDSLEDYFFLGRLSPGAKGQIELQVTLDGETQGNDYQNTLARLQMNFAAEVVEGGNTTVTKPGKDIKIIKTGDNSNLIMYLSLAAFAAGMIILIIAILLVKRRKKNTKRRSR